MGPRQGFRHLLSPGPGNRNGIGPIGEAGRDLPGQRGGPSQAGFTSDMVFGVAELVEFVTAVMTLLPGDVILTGTPAGVSKVEPGDLMEVEIDGIGVLQNRVVSAR